MPQDGRMVTEYETGTGLYAWVIDGEGYHRRLAYAVRVVGTPVAYWIHTRVTRYVGTGGMVHGRVRTDRTVRHNLRGARMWALGGNGHRERGHTEVTRVAPPMSPLHWHALVCEHQ